MIENSADGPEELSQFPDKTKIDTEIAISAQFYDPASTTDTPAKPDVDAAEPEISDDVNEDYAFETETDDALLTAPTPVLRYLRDIRSFRLLSREDEIHLAQQIEDGENQIVEEAFSSLLALRFALDLGKSSRRRAIENARRG